MRLGALLLLVPLACARREPPAPDGSPSVALPEVPAPRASPGPAAGSSSAAAAASVLAPASSAPSASSSAVAASGVFAVDPASLPQTRDRPSPTGTGLDVRVAALWAGIVQDDPEQAMPFFFPLAAYLQVKDVADPGSDWKRRLVAAYARDIHGLHARLGAGAAKLTGLEIPDARARWVDPGEEYNKLGYYRVFGSRLRYEVDGTPHTIEVKSLISWRGEWFVVHLGAIR